MRKRFTIISLVALLLMAALPGVAFAAKAFNASGVIAQDPANPGVVTPGTPDPFYTIVTGNPWPTGATSLAQAKNETGLNFLTDAFFDGLPLPGFLPGVRTLNQQFNGSLDQGWGALKNADVHLIQNSWFAADLEALGTTALAVPMAGVAWGTFELSKGNGNSLTGFYSATLLGELSTPFAPTATCATGVGVAVVDTGVWIADAASAGGAYKQIDAATIGTLIAQVAGCLGGGEVGTIEIGGTR